MTSNTEPSITLEHETIERVTDSLNALIGIAEATHGAQERVEHGRAALRELATMTGAGAGVFEDMKAQRDALEESRERLTGTIASYQHAFDTMRKALQGVSGMCADQYDDAQRQIERIHDRADEALRLTREAPSREPMFMYTTLANDPTSTGEFASLSSMLDENRDDADFCRFLRTAKPGDSYTNGGGAAPLIVTWRVS